MNQQKIEYLTKLPSIESQFQHCVQKRAYSKFINRKLAGKEISTSFADYLQEKLKDRSNYKWFHSHYSNVDVGEKEREEFTNVALQEAELWRNHRMSQEELIEMFKREYFNMAINQEAEKLYRQLSVNTNSEFSDLFKYWEFDKRKHPPKN